MWTSSSSRPTDTRAACTCSAVVARLEIDVLGEPAEWDAHQTTIPNCCEKRTSPSTMSRMSLHVVAEHERALDADAEREARSTRRGRCPAERSTFGLTMPQPPHSIQRGAALEGGVPEVELGARLGEREVVGAQAHLRVVAEHVLDEVVERAAQVGHREALVDRDALGLVEHRRVRRVELVGAEHATGCDAVERQLVLEQRAQLHRRRVRAQHEVRRRRLDEERVLHRARRVVLVEVERVEVVPLALELGALGDLPAHADEDVGDALLQQGERMPRTRAASATAAR